MAGLLIRMRLAMLRHQSGGWWDWKAWIGLALALGVLWTAISASTDPGTRTSSVALLLALWTLGLVMLSLQSGVDETDLLPEHFALLPIRPRELAQGLLAASIISPGTLILVVASLSLVASGIALGTAAALVSVPALALHVVFVLLLMRVLLSVANMALRTRIGVELVALQYALSISLLSVGWFLLGGIPGSDGLGEWLRGEAPDAAATLLRLLPTGWGAVAVGAASERRWDLAIAALLALVAINALLLLAWSRTLESRTTDRASAVSSKARWGGRSNSLRSPMQAAVWRELMHWFREPRSAIELRVAILSAVFIALIPLFVGWDQLAPFMGAILVVMAAVVSSNSYGLEGSALWLTLMTPGAVRIDVRAKQWAFLALFGPLAALTMVVPVLVTGMHWTWPWLLSFVPAGLGSGAGVMILIAALHPVPVPAAARRSGNLMASGDTTGPAYITLLLVLLLSMPGLAVTGLGVQECSVPLQVAGVLLGSGIGALTFWWGGRRAIRKLETEGPEMLSLLRRGPPADTTADVADEPGTARLPVPAQVIVGICWTLAAIALFPQAIIPAVFKLTNRDDPVWFLPLHLPERWQWPAIVAMLLIGGVFAIAALTISRRYETAKQPGR